MYTLVKSRLGVQEIMTMISRAQKGMSEWGKVLPRKYDMEKIRKIQEEIVEKQVDKNHT